MSNIPSPSPAPTCLRWKDLARHGYTRHRLHRMLQTGEAEKLGRGVYQVDGDELCDAPSLVTVALRYPGAVVGLVTALHYHNLTEQIPRWLDLIIPYGRNTPTSRDIPLRVFRMAQERLQDGEEKRELLPGLGIGMTSPEKSIIDAYVYRHRIGYDIFPYALHEYSRWRNKNYHLLYHHAEKAHVENAIQPYLEMIP